MQPARQATDLQVIVLCAHVCVCAGACMIAHIHMCVEAFCIRRVAKVSAVYRIAQLNLVLYINHTSNIDDYI